MKKFFIVFGALTLVFVVAMATFGSFGYFQGKKFLPSVERFVEDFYQRANNEEFAVIYNNLTADSMKNASTLMEFAGLMRSVYKKLGAAESQTMTRWQITYGADGTLFHVEYKVKRVRGNSVDSFLLKKIDESWLLAGYNVNIENLFKIEK